MEHRSVVVDINGVKATLNHFDSNITTPRPESFKEDYELASKNP